MRVSIIPMTIFLLCSCANGNTKKASESEPAPASQPKTAEPSQPKTAEPAQPTPAVTDVGAVSLERLDAVQKNAFLQIANDEICPCSCPQSWASCLNAETKCKTGVILAEWLVGELADDVPPENLAEQITNEISAFRSKPKDIDTSGYTSKGAEAPKYNIVEFADFECGHCMAAAPVVKELVKARSDIRVTYKHFPLSGHENAVPAAEAVEAAGAQGKFWEMHDAVFQTQTQLSDKGLLPGHARALGLDVKKWETDRASAAVKKRVAESRAEGEKLSIQATPTFFVNGRMFNLMRTREAFTARLKMEDVRDVSTCE